MTQCTETSIIYNRSGMLQNFHFTTACPTLPQPYHTNLKMRDGGSEGLGRRAWSRPQGFLGKGRSDRLPDQTRPRHAWRKRAPSPPHEERHQHDSLWEGNVLYRGRWEGGDVGGHQPHWAASRRPETGAWLWGVAGAGVCRLKRSGLI